MMSLIQLQLCAAAVLMLDKQSNVTGKLTRSESSEWSSVAILA